MKKFALVLSLMLFLFAGGCKDENVALIGGDAVFGNGDVLGEGEKQFDLTVEYIDGTMDSCTVKTEAETVGEALLDLEIIKGEDGSYGMYVKSVNNVTADYEKDGTYWAFYVDGEYATSGVDLTPIEDGKEYSLKVEK